MVLDIFHQAIDNWFRKAFEQPTEIQTKAWPEIQKQRNILISASTGSGKTLASFLSTIDDLIKQGLDGGLTDQTQVVYVSPLKALSNDIERNLHILLNGIREELKKSGLPEVKIKVLVRTEFDNQGDLIIGSSDLSHYYPVDTAKEMDGIVVEDIENMDERKLFDDIISKRSEACGYGPMRATMMTSKKLGATNSKILSHGNSGDTCGDYGSKIGYVSSGFYKLNS